jgi:phosphoribosylanthranilate isomerase
VLVKICGITRLEDAAAAVALGAGAIGFVFWPQSPRYIDPERAREIANALPPGVLRVGVFVNQAAAHVNDIASRVGLSAAQLHGDEEPDYASRVSPQVIKALTLETSAAVWPEQTMILLDAHDPIRRGGTGRTIDWTAAADFARERRTLLAGGLTPENVGEAIARVRPFGIDVSSGVESSPGIKDHQRLRALFEAVKHVEA